MRLSDWIIKTVGWKYFGGRIKIEISDAPMNTKMKKVTCEIFKDAKLKVLGA